MSSASIRLFIVDDHKLVVEGIMSMLSGAKNIQVVGSASSGEEAINMVSSLKPDVILMDIILKKMTGLEACRWIKERHPDMKVIILSMEVRKDLLSTGIQCGISGYLHKDIDQATLLSAIEAVNNGQQFFTEALTKLVFEDFYNNETRKPVARIKLPNDLTKREFEILSLVARGKSNRELAEALFISVKTVETHKAHILDKLGLKNTAELIKYAIRNNIVPA